jgi:predicted ATPase
MHRVPNADVFVGQDTRNATYRLRETHGKVMSTSGIGVRDEVVRFAEASDSLRVLLAQISPAYDRDVFAKQFVARVKDPDRQAERIVRIIEHAASTGTDLLVFPELVAPFSHLSRIEDVLAGIGRDFVACIPYEHATLGDFLPLLSAEDIEHQNLAAENPATRLVNFSRIFIGAGDETSLFTQIKLTPFSGEFSLSARDTLVCGNVLHRFVTNWGTFVFLICKDYVGEVRTRPPMPMFDFLRSLTHQGLHHVFVSALNPEPEAFIHAARSFYYLQEKSGQTYSVFLNGAEFDHTAIVFPTSPHPGARTGEHVEVLPLFEAKPAWGTQVQFPGYAERLIAATLIRLDAYASIATKEVYSPIHQAEVIGLAELGVHTETVARRKERRVPAAHNLPPELGRFIDREAERAELARLLEDPSCRLVTLVGPGGIGKSRLALRVASERVDRFPHGVWLVTLAPVTSPEFMVSRVGESLGFSFYGRREAKQQLLDYLREREMLLLLDNAEHLLEGADLVRDILEAAPGVRVLVTSRERLSLRHERVFRVLGMRVEEEAGDAQARHSPAVRLFEDGAARVGSDSALAERDRPYVLRICQLVGGMPLAIELAASWVRVLPPQEILRELERGLDFLTTSTRDVPERHRSVRAVFEQSWRLLSGLERQALMRLSTFRGGFSRAAADVVADVSLSTLSSLIDKSVICLDAAERYDLLEILRRYAHDKLTELPEEMNAVHGRHCSYFAEFLRLHATEFEGEGQRRALDEVAREIENVRAAWTWALERAGEDGAMVSVIDGFIGPLYTFYDKRGWYQDGARAFARAVDALRIVAQRTEAQDESATRALGRALTRQGAFNASLGDYVAARGQVNEGLDILRTAGSGKEIAFGLNSLCRIAVREGDYQEASRLCEECTRLGMEAGDRLIEARALDNRGNIAMQLGDYAQSRQLHERALALSRTLGYLRGIAANLNGLGNVAYNLGEALEARKYYQESLSVLEDLESRMGMSVALSNLGNIALDLGEYPEAKEFLERSLAIAKDIGFDRGIGHGLFQLGNAEERLGRHDEARRLQEESLVVYRRSGDRRGAAYTLRSLGRLSAARDDREQAHRALEEALQIFRELRVRRGVAASLVDLAELAHARGDVETSTDHLTEALTVAMGIGAAPIALSAIVTWARVFQQRGEPARAARLCAFAVSPKVRGRSVGLEATARRLLSELATRLTAEEMERAAAGEALTLREVADELLGGPDSSPADEAVS